MDTEFFGRLRTAMAGEDWPAVVQTFITQIAAGGPGYQKLIEGSIRLCGPAQQRTEPAGYRPRI